MMSIEDHIHQAFSLILKKKQTGQPFDFEGEELPFSRGPMNETGQIDLSGSCGLLGHGHPLVIKSYLHLALKGMGSLEHEKALELYIETNNQLSQITNKKVFLQPRASSVDSSLGRTSEFLSEENIRAMNDGESYSLKTIFGEVIGLGTKEISFNKEDYSITSLFMAHQISRFLMLGQFYGNHGLIKRREELLTSFFQELSSFEKVNGLIVSLSKTPHVANVLTHESLLIFPLSFDEALLSDTIKKLKEGNCT